MRTRNSSSTTFLILGGFCVVLGNMILSPGGRLFCLVVAGLAALVALFLSSGRVRRVIALLMLALVVFQTVPAWNQYSETIHRYRDRPGLDDGGKGATSTPDAGR